MKKVVLSILALVLLIAVAGLFFFHMRNDAIYRIQISGLLSPESGSESGRRSEVVFRILGVETGRDWRIRVPETQEQAVLTGITETAQAGFAFGHYGEGPQKGMVYLDYSRKQSLSLTDPQGGLWFVIPLVVDGPGSGRFWYLGLFRFDPQRAEVSHKASAFIGDRVQISSLTLLEPLKSGAQEVVLQVQGYREALGKTRMQRLTVSTQGFVPG